MCLADQRFAGNPATSTGRSRRRVIARGRLARCRHRTLGCRDRRHRPCRRALPRHVDALVGVASASIQSCRRGFQRKGRVPGPAVPLSATLGRSARRSSSCTVRPEDLAVGDQSPDVGVDVLRVHDTATTACSSTPECATAVIDRPRDAECGDVGVVDRPTDAARVLRSRSAGSTRGRAELLELLLLPPQAATKDSSR